MASKTFCDVCGKEMPQGRFARAETRLDLGGVQVQVRVTVGDCCRACAAKVVAEGKPGKAGDGLEFIRDLNRQMGQDYGYTPGRPLDRMKKRRASR